MEKILVSACLLGQPVRYDGGAKTLDHQWLKQWRDEGRLVPLCPEMAAGLPAPRAPAEIEPGKSAHDVAAGKARIFGNKGEDLTAPFLKGAQLAVDHALNHQCTFALLTDGSPSCGSKMIYSGNFDGRKQAGTGITAHLLHQAGIKVFAEQDIEALAHQLLHQATTDIT